MTRHFPFNRLIVRRLARWLILTLIGAGLAAGAADGQPAASFPVGAETAAALQAAPLPFRDRTALAQRLFGTNIPSVPVSAAARAEGERERFRVSDSFNNVTQEVEAVLRVVGEHIYLWVEDGSALKDDELRQLAAGFDQRVYPNVRALWGTEASPGVDGDPRIYGLFAHGLGPAAAAYFQADHTYPESVVPASNAHEMFFFSLDAIRTGFDQRAIESILAHEFAHMIRFNEHGGGDLWINEGLAQFTQYYLYGDAGGAVLSFTTSPDTQLNTWSIDPAERGRSYGASALFLIYLYERCGLEAVRTAALHPSPRGLEAVDHAARACGLAGVEALFADWVIANALLRPDLNGGRYGYRTLPLLIANRAGAIASPPVSWSDTVSQYAADYLRVDPDGAGRLNIRLEAPAAIPLLPVEVESRVLYSNRGDMADTTATRAFDLRGVTEAALEFRLWHDLETAWDYGYVMVSTDAGRSWTILRGERMTEENPHGAAYGAAYNGSSSGWVGERISLDAYAGREILLRFEMITDDGVNAAGMAIDDVRIDALGYVEDFEAAAAGWELDGWLITDNVLPQRTLVQAVQIAGDAVSVSAWETSGSGVWSLDIGAGTSEVLLTVSAFAPVTTIPMPYTLTVELAG